MMSDGRVVIVTGGGKGLGRAFALDLARQGCRIVVNNRVRDGQENSAEQVASEIAEVGGQAVTETSDVTAPDAGERMIARALSAFGRLDAIVFNAGVSGDAARFHEMSPENFETVMRTNFDSVVRMTRQALPRLRQSGNGRFVYVSSSAGLYGVRGRSPYVASKGALRAFALNMAIEEARYGIRANLVLPYASTRMTGAEAAEQQEGPLSPASIAPFVSWLASDTCDLNGTEWIAGAGFVRQVRVLESIGARLPGAREELAAWYRENAGSLEGFGLDHTMAANAEDAFERFLSHIKTQ
tara:strand:- start:5955 stop:6848 length:894 start_codon:yes stop_codon:yes gene_type:complete